MMSSRPYMMGDEFKVIGNAVRAGIIDGTKIKEEKDRLIRMVTHSKIEYERINPETGKKEIVLVKRINPETGEEELVPLMRIVEVEEMISSTISYVTGGKYYRRAVKPLLIQQLYIFSSSVKRHEKRGLYRTAAYMKDIIRNKLLEIITVAYPPDEALIPRGESYLFDAMGDQQQSYRETQASSKFEELIT